LPGARHRAPARHAARGRRLGRDSVHGNRISGTLLSAVLDVSGLLPADGPRPVPRATGGRTMSGIDVGIDQIGVYLPRYVLPLDRLAGVRGVPGAKILLGLGAHAMPVAPPSEAAATLAANAP